MTSDEVNPNTRHPSPLLDVIAVFCWFILFPIGLLFNHGDAAVYSWIIFFNVFCFSLGAYIVSPRKKETFLLWKLTMEQVMWIVTGICALGFIVAGNWMSAVIFLGIQSQRHLQAQWPVHGKQLVQAIAVNTAIMAGIAFAAKNLIG